jgi:hypothetical protein
MRMGQCYEPLLGFFGSSEMTTVRPRKMGARQDPWKSFAESLVSARTCARRLHVVCNATVEIRCCFWRCHKSRDSTTHGWPLTFNMCRHGNEMTISHGSCCLTKSHLVTTFERLFLDFLHPSPANSCSPFHQKLNCQVRGTTDRHHCMMAVEDDVGGWGGSWDVSSNGCHDCLQSTRQPTRSTQILFWGLCPHQLQEAMR